MTLLERWNAKMPLFWAKVHKISLWVAGLSATGGITDFIFQFLEVSDDKLFFPEYMRMAGKAMLSISFIGAIVSKLTAEPPKQ